MSDPDSLAARSVQRARRSGWIVYTDVLAPIAGLLVACAYTLGHFLEQGARRTKPVLRRAAEGVAVIVMLVAAFAIGWLLVVVASDLFRDDPEAEQTHSFDGTEDPDEPGPEPETIRRAAAEQEADDTQETQPER